jgi:hypothetical protein
VAQQKQQLKKTTLKRYAIVLCPAERIDDDDDDGDGDGDDKDDGPDDGDIADVDQIKFSLSSDIIIKWARNVSSDPNITTVTMVIDNIQHKVSDFVMCVFSIKFHSFFFSFFLIVRHRLPVQKSGWHAGG